MAHLKTISFPLTLILLCSSSLLLFGCGAEILTVTAIQGELAAKNAKAATGQLNYVKNKMGSVGFDQAVQAYRAEHGVNPPSLDALVPKYLAEVPRQSDGSLYGYDPATGTLSSSAVGAPSSGQDQQMLRAIQNAITRYGTATGYYPPTLDDLYPTYLTQLPRTSTGQQFVYNNQNGYLALPGQTAAPAAPAPSSRGRGGGGGLGGAGPLGEVMTGVGIQQELGRMSTGGSSAAGSRARSGAQGFSDQHTNKQNQVMDQLGL
ncbi:MAG: hypothetical protein GX130_01875 [Candidatus Hydrogenedens sp.]|nr:hypothetical protein [Candidatus Hydrogenedens sp.]